MRFEIHLRDRVCTPVFKCASLDWIIRPWNTEQSEVNIGRFWFFYERIVASLHGDSRRSSREMSERNTFPLALCSIWTTLTRLKMVKVCQD